MKHDLYLIELGEPVDKTYALLDEEVWAWVKREDTPGRNGNEKMWKPDDAPEAVLTGNDGPVVVTINSFKNDKAVAALGAALCRMRSRQDIASWLVENNARIADGYRERFF